MTEQTTTYEWRGRAGPFTLSLPPGVFVPSSISRELAAVMEVEPGSLGIDEGSGCGLLAFVAARLGAGKVYGCDVSELAMKVAEENARLLGLDESTEFRVGNLFEPVEDVTADFIIGDVSGIPDALAEATGWFPDGKGGGPTGAELPIAMLEGIGDCLRVGGVFYLPTGTIQDDEAILSVAREVFGQENVEKLSERQFPLPGEVVQEPGVVDLIDEGIVRLTQRGSRQLWKLSIWRCTRL
jgi:hypothetical protein